MNTEIYVLVFLSAFMHALWNLAARKVKGDMGVLWLSVLLATLISTPVYFVISVDFSVYLEALPYILASGIIHVFYFIFLAKSYEQGHISFVYPIARGTGVAGTAVLAFILLDEQISMYGGIAIALILCGTITMALGNYTTDKKSGVLAFSVGISIAFYSIVDKLGVQKIHPVIYIAQMFFFSIVVATPYIILKHKERCINAFRERKKYILIVGCGSISTYALILFAFRLGHVSYVVALRECSVVLGAIFGILFFKERCSVKKVLAIMTIVCGVILLKVS